LVVPAFAAERPPYLAPHFATEVAIDALAASYSLELLGPRDHDHRSGLVQPQDIHYANADHEAVVAEYETLYCGLLKNISQKIAAIEPPDADVSEVARSIVTVVDTQKGKRPFRVHIDPNDDGAATVNAVADRMGSDFMRRLDLADLLRSATA
jgi:hypothetical protein